MKLLARCVGLAIKICLCARDLGPEDRGGSKVRSGSGGRSGRRTGQCIGDNIVRACYKSDIGSVFQNALQLPALTGRVTITGVLDGTDQWPVIRDYMKVPVFKVFLEVVDGADNGEEFSTKSAVRSLRRVKLARKEGERLPSALDFLLKNATHGVI